MASLDVVAPTVQAVGAEAGEKLAVLPALLPAATARKTPLATRRVAAAFMVEEKLPPRDMLAMTPRGQLRPAASPATKSMPAMTPAVVPEPEALRTLTA